MSTSTNTRRRASGFTMVEIVIVLVMMGVIFAMAIPRLDLSQYRSDAAAQQVRSVFQTAQRTSLTRQYDVIVSVDTVQRGLRIAEDYNNDGTIQVSEWKFWRPLGEGNRFYIPTKGVNITSPTSSVNGSLLKTVSSMPSIIFHRDGSASTDAEIFIASTNRSRTDVRAVTLTRSTGRAEVFRMSGTGSGLTWQVVR